MELLHFCKQLVFTPATTSLQPYWPSSSASVPRPVSLALTKLSWELSNSRADILAALSRVVPTGLLITLVADIPFLFEAIFNILNLDALLLASRSFDAALDSKWLLDSVHDGLEYLLNCVQGTNEAGDERDGKESEMSKGPDVAQGTDKKLPTLKLETKGLRKLLLEDWEVVENEGEAKNGESSCTNEGKRLQALLDDVNRLIDECQGLENVDWDGAIAALETRQKDGKLVEK